MSLSHYHRIEENYVIAQKHRNMFDEFVEQAQYVSDWFEIHNPKNNTVYVEFTFPEQIAPTDKLYHAAGQEFKNSKIDGEIIEQADQRMIINLQTVKASDSEPYGQE